MSKTLPTTRLSFLAEPRLSRLLDVLNQGVEEAMVAGGAVRNALLGLEPDDVDVATTRLPDDVVRAAGAAGLKTVPTGYAHGTVTVFVDGEGFEVTTLRRDVETDGRHAVVAFGRSFAEDAQRRDFTINALFADRGGFVHDHVGGLADVAARRVRFVGNADARVREDYLRILRFFRFQSNYGAGEPDGEALAAARANAEGLGRLSAERVRVEMLKIVSSRRAVEACATMDRLGLYRAMLPKLSVSPERLAAAVAGGLERGDPFLRLAVLVEGSERDMAKYLRLSSVETSRASAMRRALALDASRLPGVDASGLPEWVRVSLYRNGKAATQDAIVLALSAGLIDAGAAASAKKSTWLTSVPIRPWRGCDIVAQGVAQGPAVGAVLERATEAWVAAGLPTDTATTRAILEAALAPVETAPAAASAAP